MGRFHTYVALAFLPLGSWSCANGTGESTHGPVVGLDGEGGTAAPVLDGASPPAADGSSDATTAATPSDGGGPDAGPGSGPDACVGSVAVVGGTVAGASTIAFAATLVRDGSWAVSSLPSNVASAPAIAAFGGGYVVAFVNVYGDLEFSTSTWSWSSPAAVADQTATGTPSLAVVGDAVHLVYQGAGSKFFHGTYTASGGWDSANDPIGGASKQGFGPSAPVAASVAGELVIAYGGQNGSLYDETWTLGAWQPDQQHTTAAVGTLAPAIAAMQGGASDTLVVYAAAGGTLYSTARSGGAWSAPAVINTNAFTNTAPALLALAGGRAMMSYLGTDELPYFSVYDPSITPSWTAPAPIGAGSPKLASPPSMAPGVCGDEVVAVLTEPAGVATIRYASGAWQSPAVIAGTAGMTFASVASQPSASPAPAAGAGGEGDGGTFGGVHVDPSGEYSIAFQTPAWTFSGSLGAPVTSIAQVTGVDGVGSYHEVTFAFTDTSAKTAGIRAYDQLPAAILTETYTAATTNAGPPFPTFTTYPQLPHHVTYGDTEFAPVSFDALTSDSPFVFFDDDANTFILSAASDFMNTATAQTASGALTSGIDPAVTTLPASLSHRTVLVAEPGINAAYATWGGVLTSLSGKKRVASDATPYLERLGYWTDNGAYYYYQYDTSIGYPATLTALSQYFTGIGVPLAYMQLDSWWYPKGPTQSWSDKADGQYTYTADPTVLPSGLASFQQSLGLPLITHARWIDPSSPYRSEYAMSNDVSIDPAYWASIAGTLAGSGVTVYEQDWLNQNALPATTNLTDQAAFMDDMASAMAAKGIDLQYCMPLPRHYLQGSKYPNLTTTRVSVDRFSSPRYVDFLYVSLLTSSLGAWPWSDTFDSTETDNLLLATLSAGMVGVGDESGTASAANLLQAVRPDGVIVKPDAPIVPIDQTFVDQASGVDAPLVAATYSDFGGVRASYVYAFNVGTSISASFTPAALGLSGKVLVFNYFENAGHLVDASAAYTEDLSGGSAYYVVVPVGPSGIAFAGDAGKFVSLGKKRITAVTDTGTLSVGVAFASGETSVTLHGYAPSQPTATASVGSVGTVAWDAATGMFRVPVMPASSGTATVTLQ